MIKFNYTKANGTTTQRKGIVVSSPVKNYGILDLSELSEDTAQGIADQVSAYYAAREAALAELATRFNMSQINTQYYKAFKPEGIEVLSETV